MKRQTAHTAPFSPAPQGLLHENNAGIQIIRTNYKKRSKIVVRDKSGNFIKQYRCNNLPHTLSSPYISWANLDCCNGWKYDKDYLKYAVQQGKKLYAGISFFTRTPEQQANTDKYIEELRESLPFGTLMGIEKTQKYAENRWINMYVCRTGTLKDYYDLDAVFAFYAELGILLSDESKQKIRTLCEYEIAKFSSRQIPFDYAKPDTDEECIVTGLLLGYPLESTASFMYPPSR